MALYTDLPGVELTIKDGNLVLPSEPVGTRRVLIIAPTSSAGKPYPANVNINAVRVSGTEDFNEYRLGLFNESNPMARRWKQVHDAGCKDIYVIELLGETPEERYKYLHEIYTIIEENLRTDIILLDGVKVDTSVNTPEVDLIRQRQDYMALGGTAKPLEALAKDTFAFAAGEDNILFELTKPVLAIDSVLIGTDPLTVETDYTVDYDTATVKLVTPLETGESLIVNYSTYNYNFADQLAGFCAIVTAKNNQVIGIMSVTPPADSSLSAIKNYVDRQVTQIHNQFLQVVGGPTMFFEIANQPYEDDFSGSYAGLISYLPSYSSPTNKVIPGALWASFNLSPSQIKALTNKHIVVPRTRNGRVVVADAITTAPDKSDFVRLTTVQIVNDAVQLVREICEPYIGEPNTLPRRNALETQIKTALGGMVKRGALNDFRFSIKASLSDQLDGNMRIALDLVPVFETRRIFITVAVKPSL